jgi:two-component system OmpR family response regulator
MILIVDDDPNIREVVRFTLVNGGYQVIEARDGAEALTIFGERSIELIVLDIVMPESDGLTVCRTIRAGSAPKNRVPIMFVSSRDDELDRVLGLEMGADDYLVKPFSPRELLARAKAMLRRNHQISTDPPAKSEIVRYGDLTMDIARHRCTWCDTPIVLTVTEFALLETMARAPGRVFSRDALVDNAYGGDHVITDRTVDSHIRRVRSKLAAVGADPIETVYGLGYRIREL